MKKKLMKYLRAAIFIFLFIALVGTFLNQKEKFHGAMAQLYGDVGTNVAGVVALLIGWVFWEFAIGKRKSMLVGAISIIFLIIALMLIGQMLGFIGIGGAVASMIPIMVLELDSKNLTTMFRKKNV